ncbi:nitrile hydratase subunit beta [Burkholderiaceae bacterium FT117]|uniref:nitrile hydratase subunit beta n=1 Tax=Zeimonas sediminis TaxID=2944268 RepID=UPI0023432309|nr:nitrile hydratase subunit beta [Zeimonas sediminis]MCM5569749.1 nitrile hydratase subunit beta [Zeimonas sediminis]
MNGAQDLGGQHGFGPVVPEPNEPVFHDEWERHAMAMTILMGPIGGWNIDQSRAARESLPPAQYLSSSYYEIWLAGLEKLMTERGILSAEEIAAGKALAPRAAIPPALSAGQVGPMLARGGPSEREAAQPARFAVGDRVRTQLMNPVGHTRLPRYARGRPGTIAIVHGVHVFPDSSGNGKGENPQWLYSVRFEAADLWGPDTTASAVYVDCWEPYLEPA